MGFYIDDLDVNYKQHVNLSNYAWSVIDDDIANFNNCMEKTSFSGFLNRIFKNFYDKSVASISLRNMELLDKLRNLFSLDKKSNKDKVLTNTFITTLVNYNSDNLIKNVKSYSKDEGRKFRINKENIDILKESLEANNYTNSIGLSMNKSKISDSYERKSISSNAVNSTKTLQLTSKVMLSQ